MKRWTLSASLLLLSACQLSAPPPRPAAAHPAESAVNAPLGLPALPATPDNPLTQRKVDLGRQLFMDRRLSHNNTFSCAMCHVPEQGFTSHDMGTAIGMEGRSMRRNSPTLFNVGYQLSLFDDGREFSLENQVWGPLLNHAEMAMPSIGYVVEKVRALPEYNGQFETAFGGPVNAERIGQALASFERTLVSGNSRFDRWHYGGDQTALNPQQQRGYQIFTSKGRCSSCHQIDATSALFTDHQFHNTGLGWQRSLFPERRSYRVQLAPGQQVQVAAALLRAFEPPQADVGRYEVTLDPKDRWAYKTPTLRNVALTAPYMHDGSLATLAEVVAFYNQGGIDNENKSPLLAPLGLDAAEQADLVAFLHSLTGDNVAALVAQTRRTAINLPAPARDPADLYLESALRQP